jgi:hypothetical protein
LRETGSRQSHARRFAGDGLDVDRDGGNTIRPRTADACQVKP